MSKVGVLTDRPPGTPSPIAQNQVGVNTVGPAPMTFGYGPDTFPHSAAHVLYNNLSPLLSEGAQNNDSEITHSSGSNLDLISERGVVFKSLNSSMPKTCYFTGSTSGPELASNLSKNKMEIGGEGIKPIPKPRTSIYRGDTKNENVEVEKPKPKPRKLGVENKNEMETSNKNLIPSRNCDGEPNKNKRQVPIPKSSWILEKPPELPKTKPLVKEIKSENFEMLAFMFEMKEKIKIKTKNQKRRLTNHK